MAPVVVPNLDFLYPDPGTRLNDGRYEFLRHLGSGQYSTTWLAVDLMPSADKDDSDLKYFAVKILTRDATEQHRHGIMDELAFHRAIKDVQSVTNVAKIENDFEIEGLTGPHLCLVFDPMGPDVIALRKTAPNEALKPYIVKKIIHDVALALEGLHANKIIHTDVKGDNILCHGNAMNSLIEEDLAKYNPEVIGEFDVEGKKHFVYAEEPSYTTLFMGRIALPLRGQWVGQQPTVDVMTQLALRPPEIVLGSNLGPRVDIWALGCLTFELLAGEWLFNPVANGDEWTAEEDLLAQILSITGQRFSPATLIRAQWKAKILDGEGNLLRRTALPPTSFEERLASFGFLPEKEVKGAADFLRQCLQLEYANRPTAEEISGHEWLYGWMCCED